MGDELQGAVVNDLHQTVLYQSKSSCLVLQVKYYMTKEILCYQTMLLDSFSWNTIQSLFMTNVTELEWITELNQVADLEGGW